TPDGNLTSAEKKRILLNNIYGVDIDVNAVEVTKLSLLLKCMEGETETSIAQQQKLWHERILPNLGENIKSGNSLVDTDFYDSVLDFGEEKKIKPFNWQRAFPEVFENGGFDAVIGNPPYGAAFTAEELTYFKTNYKTSVWRGESYLLFIEKGLNLLKDKGSLGFIIPDTLLNLGFTSSSRKYLLQNSKLGEMVLLPSNVFSGATVDTIILLTEKAHTTQEFHQTGVLATVFNKKSVITNLNKPERSFKTNTKIWHEQDAFNLQTNPAENDLIEKIEIDRRKISEIAEMFSGIKAYEVGKGNPAQTKNIRDTKPFTADFQKTQDWQPLFDGKHIGRYQLLWQKNNWINYGEWLAAPRKPEVFEGEKILIRKITGKTLISNYIPYTSYCNTLLFVLKIKDENYSYPALTGVLNSSLIGWYFRKKFQISDDDTFPQIMIRDILQFPVPELNNKSGKEIGEKVELLIQLNKELQTAKIPSKTEQLQTRINHTENRINRLVYMLYGLTEEEIALVEGEGK
ncbi:MAG: N-6 DNA methylase, partial [Mariniphaga sp.]|nr:N-6 DNA methylase [Mariniphaga sp.]